MNLHLSQLITHSSQKTTKAKTSSGSINQIVTLEKKKTFFWKVFNKGIPNTSLLFKRNVAPSPTCPICNSQEETSKHALRDCINAQTIWSHLPTPQNFYNQDLKTWLSTNTQDNTHTKLDIPWSTIFLFTIYAIWLNKNNLLFQNESKPPSHIAKIALGMTAEYYSNLETSITLNSPSLSNPTPDPTWFKLNTDSSIANFLMGAGGCLRDEASLWLAGFSKFVRIGNTIHVGLWGIFLGLSIATETFLNTKQDIETDSIQANDLLQNNTSDVHPPHSLIGNCKLLLCKLAGFKIIKAARSQNRYANPLAKEGRINRLPLTVHNKST